MFDILLNMLLVLAIIIVGVLILATVGIAVYMVLWVIYRFFINHDENDGGRK